MFNYRDFFEAIWGGIFVSFFVWGAYRLVLLVTDYSVPFTTLQIEVLSFLPLFIGVTIAIIILILLEKKMATPKKIKRNIISKFSVLEAQVRSKIVEEKDEVEKAKLEQKALELRREHLLLLNENLQKKDGSFVEDWREVLLVSRKRLVDEEERLLLNNRVNIEVAIFTALAGISLPLYYIFSGESAGVENTFETFFASYWPIFSIVVIFEIIAMFFLRVYNQTAGRIERNKNEITNIELRLTAGLMLSEKTNKDKFAKLADTLSKEERNFILRKNESSAILDTDKLVEIASKFVPKIGG